MWRWLVTAGAVTVVVVLLLIGGNGTARAADDTALSADPREEALKEYAQAKEMFASADYVAAAVMFDQAQQLFGRIERDASGAIVDAEAHAYRGRALSNKASAYSQAGFYVEALDAFTQRRELFGPELTEKERQELEDAITNLTAKIGTVTLHDLPDELTELRLDGRRFRLELARAPIRMAEGDHSIEVRATGYQPWVTEFTVVRAQDRALAVKLDPLTTPARVRIEATVGAAEVSVDDVARGPAPIELTVAPGPHRYTVTSESYVRQEGVLDAKPGERAVVRVGLVRARAPLGLRVEPFFLFSFPLRTDTPFGDWGGGIGLQMFHDYLRFRSVRFGFNVEYHPRDLNSVGVGAVAMWCPDRFVWRGGTLGWCPGTFVFNGILGGTAAAGEFDSGDQGGRLTSAVEYRPSHGAFVRLAAGLGVDSYRRLDEYLPGKFLTTVLILWSTSLELSVGLDL